MDEIYQNAISLIKRYGFNVYKDLNEKIRSNRDVTLEAMRLSPYPFKGIPDNLLTDPYFFVNVVSLPNFELWHEEKYFNPQINKEAALKLAKISGFDKLYDYILDEQLLKDIEILKEYMLTHKSWPKEISIDIKKKMPIFYITKDMNQKEEELLEHITNKCFFEDNLWLFFPDDISYKLIISLMVNNTEPQFYNKQVKQCSGIYKKDVCFFVINCLNKMFKDNNVKLNNILTLENEPVLEFPKYYINKVLPTESRKEIIKFIKEFNVKLNLESVMLLSLHNNMKGILEFVEENASSSYEYHKELHQFDLTKCLEQKENKSNKTKKKI